MNKNYTELANYAKVGVKFGNTTSRWVWMYGIGYKYDSSIQCAFNFADNYNVDILSV